MAIKTTTVTVPATAGGIILADATNDRDGLVVQVHVLTGGQTVYIGGSDVTTANGFPIATGTSSIEMRLARGEKLYGIVSATTQEVRVRKHSAL